MFAPLPGETGLETWLRRVHPDDLGPRWKAFAQFPEGSLPENAYRIVLDDGSVRYLLSRTTDVVRDQEGPWSRRGE